MTERRYENQNETTPPPPKKKKRKKEKKEGKKNEKKVEGQNSEVVRFEHAPPEKDTKYSELHALLSTAPLQQF